MPNGCVMTFEPFAASSVHEPLGLVPGNIYGQSTEAIDIGDGTCKHLIARPTFGETGDIIAMSCNCPDGSTITAEPTWTDAGDIVWQEPGFEGDICECGPFVFPCFIEWTMPSSRIYRTAGGDHPTGWGAVFSVPLDEGFRAPCGFALDDRRTFVRSARWTRGLCPGILDDPASLDVAYGFSGTQSPYVRLMGTGTGDTLTIHVFDVICDNRINAIDFGGPECVTLTQGIGVFTRWRIAGDLTLDRNSDGRFYIADLFPITLPTFPSEDQGAAVTLSISDGPETEFVGDDSRVSGHRGAYVGCFTTGPFSEPPSGCCPCGFRTFSSGRVFAKRF